MSSLLGRSFLARRAGREDKGAEAQRAKTCVTTVVVKRNSRIRNYCTCDRALAVLVERLE